MTPRTSTVLTSLSPAEQHTLKVTILRELIRKEINKTKGRDDKALHFLFGDLYLSKIFASKSHRDSLPS